MPSSFQFHFLGLDLDLDPVTQRSFGSIYRLHNIVQQCAWVKWGLYNYTQFRGSHLGQSDEYGKKATQNND